MNSQNFEFRGGPIFRIKYARNNELKLLFKFVNQKKSLNTST